MSFLSDFENRIADLFETAPQGYVEPFSFKKLAKRAAREMENETYEIDGIETAPALYTVLVSSVDDALMRPLYASITEEVASFVALQANKKGYVFVGKPLVRFMVDPSLKSGKFAVFAENIDAATLSRLRIEEKEFLAGNAGVGGAAAQSGVLAAPVPSAAPGLIPLAPPAPVDDGLAIFDEDITDGSDPFSSGDLAPLGAMPQTQRRSEPVATPMGRHAAHFAVPPIEPEPEPEPEPIQIAPVASALLIDRQSGRTFKVEEPSAILGRERSQADVVLNDPNISRRHAQLVFDGRFWHIEDLRSTNGTLVNDVDIDKCVLHSGDLITIGLTNLEFREN